MDVCLLIKQRLEDLGFEQRDLAAAAEVTESYISQLLTRKKLPPAPDRTDLYHRMETFLKLPNSKLSKLAELQRKEEWKRNLAEPPAPLLREARELILAKCPPEKQKQIRAIFEQQPFGELERLVTQKLLDVAKRVASEELGSESWLRLVAGLVGRSYEQMRVIVLDFLDADVFSLSVENCESFLGPLVESWDIDLATFAMEIVLNRRLTSVHSRRVEFVEKDAERPAEDEPGFKRFVRDRSLSGSATKEETDFLKRLQFDGRKPTALYFYRELQNLRDPLHFEARPAQQAGVSTDPKPESAATGSLAKLATILPMQKYLDARGFGKRPGADSGKPDGGKKVAAPWDGSKSKRGKKQTEKA